MNMGVKLIRRKTKIEQVKAISIKFYRFVKAPRPVLNTLLSNFITLFNTLIAIGGLLIAIETYKDQQESGPKQQAALDASRKALEAVVRLSQDQNLVLEKSSQALTSGAASLNQQQKLINQNLGISKEQLLTLNEQWKEQQEQFNRKPKFEVTIGNIPKYIAETGFFPMELDSNRWGIIPLTIRNVGNASAYKTSVFCEADQETIRLSDFKGINYQMANPYWPNIFTYRGLLDADIPPQQGIKFPHLFYCYVQIPKNIDRFFIKFHVFSSNAEASTVSIKYYTP